MLNHYKNLKEVINVSLSLIYFYDKSVLLMKSSIEEISDHQTASEDPITQNI